MTVTYGFYDSLNGDRKYNAIQLSQLFRGIITDGIFQSIGQGFVVGAPGLMNVSVGSGRAWFNDTWTDNDAAIQLTVLASEPVLPRIDTVVIEVNSAVATRVNSIKVIKGTPASSPVAPTMANTATLHQYPLADVYVAAGVSSIEIGNITNRISVAGGTPFITGILTSFDVATLFGQFESNFDAWFQNLQDELDANQAANLQNQINQLFSHDNFGWIPVADSWSYVNSNTVSIPSNGTLKYQKYMKVRFKQGGAYKHFYCVNVAATSLTLIAGNVNSVTNAPITDIYYSISDNCFGFPPSHTFSPQSTGFASISGEAGFFSISGGVFSAYYSVVGISNAPTVGFTSPLPIPGYMFSNLWVFQPASSANPCLLEAQANNVINVFRDGALSAWNSTGNKQIGGTYNFPLQ